MPVIFVAGTDTGVGKTVVMELLARRLSSRGYKVATQKWVETGVAKSQAVCSFKLAASPHLAARREGKKVNIKKIKESLRKLSNDHDFVLVEGTGGLLVPLDEKSLFIDIVNELKLPVLLVSANRLGTINHTLLSMEALKKRKMKVLGVVFNNISRKENKLILKDNPKIVKRFRKVPVAVLPFMKELSDE